MKLRDLQQRYVCSQTAWGLASTVQLAYVVMLTLACFPDILPRRKPH